MGVGWQGWCRVSTACMCRAGPDFRNQRRTTITSTREEGKGKQHEELHRYQHSNLGTLAHTRIHLRTTVAVSLNQTCQMSHLRLPPATQISPDVVHAHDPTSNIKAALQTKFETKRAN